MDLTVLADRVAVCRQPPGTSVPSWLRGDALSSVTWTADETSIVALESSIPPDVQSEGGWRALMVAGPMEFSLTGVLASIAQPLADATVSIFAVSTFDTDYILVPEKDLDAAVAALKAAGHRVAMS